MMFKIHQFWLDKMCKLQWFCEDQGWGNIASDLRAYTSMLVTKQVQRRAKAGMPVIQCHVVWGGGVIDD